jgi:hypothetical protein
MINIKLLRLREALIITRDLVELIIIHVVVQKRSRISFSLSTICFEPSQKIRMPSTKCKCEVEQLSIKIPLTEPFANATLRALLIPSTTRRKSK